MVGGRRDRRVHLDVRQAVGSGQSVVEHRAGQELAVLVVDALLPHGLADALHDPAVDLALNDDGIDLRAAVVHRDVALQLHVAGLRVHLHDSKVGAVREDEVRRIVERCRLQPGLHSFRHVPGHVRHERDVLDGLAGVGGALDEEVAVLVLHVLDCRLEQVRGDDLRLVPDLASGKGECGPANRCGAAAVGPPAHRRALGVAVDDLHVVRRDAQFARNDLGERRFLALTVRGCADHDVDLPAGMEPQDGALPEAALEADRAGHLRRPEAADLHIGREPEADVAALFSRGGLLGAETLVPSFPKQLGQGAVVVAAVVGQARDHVVSVVELRDEVAPANLRWVQSQPGGEQVHEALDHERRLGPAGSAVGLHRGCVGVDAVHVLVNGRNVVDPREHEPVQDRGDAWGRRRQVRSHACVNGRPQAGDLAVTGSGHLDFLHMVASVSCGLVVLASRLHPLHRHPELLRAEDGDEVGGIDRNLAAEAAAHLGRDDAELVLGHAVDEGAQESHNVRVLGRVPERQLSGGLHVAGKGRARLHGIRDEALLDDGFLHDHLGRAESLVDVPAAGHGPVEGLIALDFVVELRRVLGRSGLGRNDRVQRLVVDIDQVERVVRLTAALRDDHGHDVTHVPHRILCDAVVFGNGQTGIGQEPCAGRRSDLVHGVGVRVYGDDAACLGRCGCVDTVDAGVRVRAAEHGGMQRARKDDVVGVGGAARDQPGVFPPADPGTKR